MGEKSQLNLCCQRGAWAGVLKHRATGSSTFSVGSGEVEVTCREVEHGNEVID
jgi:hypothetical protein